jgi:DNA repair photolyase
VDLADRLLELLGPVSPGGELVPGVRVVRASTELGLRLTFEAKGQLAHVELTPIDEAKHFAARTERFAIAFLNGVEQALGKALCDVVAAAVRRNEAAVLDALVAEAASAPTQPDPKLKIRSVTVKRILERAGPTHYTLSPYVGCLIGCRFCYAQSRVALVRRLERLPAVPWGSYVDVRVNAAEALRADLAALPPAAIKFCPIVSDPYQAVEQREGITRACLEVLAGAGPQWPALVLTRSTLIERDAELLASLPGAHAGMSIPTSDEDVARHFEPRAAAISERLRTLDRLKAAGVTTFAVVQPMLPGDVTALADALATRVSSVSLDVLHSLEGAQAEFGDPRFAHAREPQWQRERLERLADALTARGVAVWSGELPPALTAPR